MTVSLKQNSLAARQNQDFSTMHSFRSGGVVSRALAGEYFINPHEKSVCWKIPSMACRYMTLAEVLSPGTPGQTKGAGIAEEQNSL